MRLKYYLTTIRQMKLNKSFVLFLLILLSLIIIIYIIYFKNIRPTLKTLSEVSVNALALKSCNYAVNQNIKGIGYNDLITIQKDNLGKIIALTANVSKINEISNQVVIDTQKNLENTEEEYIKVPIGALLGTEIFGAHGFKIKINTLPAGICNAEFKSSFSNAGINQTLHKITLVITIKLKTIAPFYSDIQEYKNEIAIAETVIVGDIPDSYYNLQGIENLDRLDTTEFME